MTDSLSRIEHKLDAILHWIQSSSGMFAHKFGDEGAVCPLCFEPVQYQPVLDGSVKRICGCQPPVQSVPVDNFKKKEV